MSRPSLPTPRDFSRVRAARLSVASDALLLQAAKTPDGMVSPRLGLVITKKAGGNAVARNRLARVLREAFWTRVVSELPTGYDYVIVTRAGLADLDNDGGMHAVADELSRAARRLSRRLAN